MDNITVSALYIYPIKSLQGIAIQRMNFDALGAIHDRRYMLVNDKGLFVTQREYAKLCLIAVRAVTGGWQVQLPKSEDKKTLAEQGCLDKPVSVVVWQDIVQAYDQGDAWAQFFSNYLAAPVRLVYMPDNTHRVIDKTYYADDRHVSFADGYPLLLCSESSLAVLNSSLSPPVNMTRFRPNIVIRGAAAFTENTHQRLSFREERANSFAIVKPCSRCVIPTIEPSTAKKQAQVWQALKKHCLAEDGQVYFGQNVIHQNKESIAVGQVLYFD